MILENCLWKRKILKKDKNNYLRDRVLSRFWSFWSSSLMLKGIAYSWHHQCAWPGWPGQDTASSLCLSGFLTGGSMGSSAPETRLTHCFYAVPWTKANSRYCWSSLKNCTFVKWPGFQKCSAPVEQKIPSGQRVFWKIWPLSEEPEWELLWSDLLFFFSNLSFTLLGLGADFSKYTQAHNWGLPFPVLQSSAYSPLRGANVVQILSRRCLILLSEGIG